MTTSGATMTVDACARMVAAANGACPSPLAVASSHPTGAPASDALANSFAGLGVALTWGSIMLAAVALVAAVGWGFFVRSWAEREARKAAAEEVRRVARGIMNDWLTTEGIAILRQANQMTQPATSSGGGDVADAIAASAGEGEP